MKSQRIICGSLVAWLTLAGMVFANDGGEARFDHIRTRNVFGLKEPPPPPPPPSAPVPAAVVKLTGITTILIPKRAILQIQLPGQRDESIVLREGDRFGVVQLTAIDVAGGAVTILNDGQFATLNMAKHGVAIPVGLAPSLAALASHATPAAGSRPPISYAGVVTVQGRSIKVAGTNVHSGILETPDGSDAVPPASTFNMLPPDPAELLRARIEQARQNLKSPTVQ